MQHLTEIRENSFHIQLGYTDNYRKSNIYYFLKRTIDICGALLGIVLLGPIMIITVLAIKLDSDGPVLFTQLRVGKDGEVFNMYKFRSMVTNAEKLLNNIKNKNEMSGPMFKMKNDPRVTRVGRFLRKTSVDELPQLFNVLKGEMSLVGPRPNLPKEVAQFNDIHRLKLLAKPGITCYWQVMGRNNIGFEDWMKLDIKYVEERNIWVDLKLIFRTVGVLFGDKNAA